jgi:hypothetical protein
VCWIYWRQDTDGYCDIRRSLPRRLVCFDVLIISALKSLLALGITDENDLLELKGTKKRKGKKIDDPDFMVSWRYFSYWITDYLMMTANHASNS